MPNRCAAAGCRGNYDGEPSVPMVKFPKDPEERQRWIDAMPNDPETLKGRKDLWICMSHFKCDFVKIKGGIPFSIAYLSVLQTDMTIRIKNNEKKSIIEVLKGLIQLFIKLIMKLLFLSIRKPRPLFKLQYLWF